VTTSILSIKGLGKCYYLPQPRPQRATQSRAPGFLGAVRRVWQWPISRWTGAEVREFWALRDVSIEVPSGTVLGIIGANGAGKSTLLKIIARVSPPTQGRVAGVGRVVSLLELGAGFNPEGSARENIFMNAAMCGISKTEAERNFDKIIEFAELGNFIDTRLKYYSSGMYLRLAFSVAINMNPAILLADEILAVGDLNFQERCLQRVEELSKQGLTVLFVSHDMEAIIRVSDRVLWLNEGRIANVGNPEEVVAEYQNAAWARVDLTRNEQGRHASRFAELIDATLVSSSGKQIGAAPTTEDVDVRIRFVVKEGRLERVRFGFDMYYRNTLLFRSTHQHEEEFLEPGRYEAWARIPKDFLSEILYSLNTFLLFSRNGKDSSLIMRNALSFSTYSTDESSVRRLRGLFAPRLHWKLDKGSEVAHG